MNRRNFITTSGLALSAALLPRTLFAFDTPGSPETVIGWPGEVWALVGGQKIMLSSKDKLRWEKDKLRVQLINNKESVGVEVSAPGVALESITLKWIVPSGGESVVMNDGWERTYADCSWESRSGETILPWYFLEN